MQQADQAPRQESRYIALEGIRGLAAFLVAGRHMLGLLDPFSSMSSYLAVDIFFLLSGFVLSASYEQRLHTGGLSRSRLAILRLIRLYPLYILGSVLGFAVLICTGQASEQTAIALLVRAALFLPVLQDGVAMYPLDHPAWSLFFELFVSLLYAALLFRASTVTLAVVALSSGLVLAIGVVGHGSADLGYQAALFWFGLARVLCSFVLGMLIYRFRAGIAAHVAPLGNRGTLIVYGAALILFFAPLPIPGLAAALFGLIAIFAVFPALTALCVMARPTGVVSRASMWLGRMSFPIYALHVPVKQGLEAIATQGFDLRLADYAPISGFCTLALIVVVSELAVRFYDEPVRSVLRSIRPRRW